MSETRKRIIAGIREILLADWDPIGVREFPEKYRRAANDEYDSYIAPLIEMLSAGKSVQDVADFLYDVEVRRMGRRRDRTCADAAARKLVDIEVR